MGKLCYTRSDIVQRAMGSLYYREDVVASELWQISLPFVRKKKECQCKLARLGFFHTSSHVQAREAEIKIQTVKMLQDEVRNPASAGSPLDLAYSEMVGFNA